MKKDNSDHKHRNLPILYDVEAGKIYQWCGCGNSSSAPICDSHEKACVNQKVAYHAIISEAVLFCGCKKTKEPPFCDGSHADIQDG